VPCLRLFCYIKNVITRKVNTGNYSNQNNWSPVPTLNDEINDRVRWPVLGLSPLVLLPTSPIAKILVCPDFPPLKIPRYTAKLSYRHPPQETVPITSQVVSLNPAHCEMYSMQHYVIKFASDLLQVSDILWVCRIPLPIKLTAMI
jgi:hypothetical protein